MTEWLKRKTAGRNVKIHVLRSNVAVDFSPPISVGIFPDKSFPPVTTQRRKSNKNENHGRKKSPSSVLFEEENRARTQIQNSQR